MTTQIAEYSQTEAALGVLADKFKGVVYDVTTKEGMAAAKAGRNEIRGYRTALEAKRVEIKAPALERCRLIDAEAKRITAELEALEDPIAAQIKKEEDRIAAEKAAKEEALRRRVEEIQAKLQAMRELPMVSFGATSEQMQEYIAALEAQEITEEAFGDFMSDAENLKIATLATMKLNLNTKLTQEAEATRLKAEREALERQQAEQAARDAEAARQREEDERHICPLQIQVIERALDLWSNPGDVVLSPFGGIGSEGYVSLQKGRRFIGVELKESYWKVACKNLDAAKKRMGDLFGEAAA
jgi:colicin import membrane protein